MSQIKEIKDSLKAQIASSLPTDVEVFAGVSLDTAELANHPRFAILHLESVESEDSAEVGPCNVRPQMETWRWLILLGTSANDPLDDAYDAIDELWSPLRDGLQGFQTGVSGTQALEMSETYEPVDLHPSGNGMVVAVRANHLYWSCP